MFIVIVVAAFMIIALLAVVMLVIAKRQNQMKTEYDVLSYLKNNPDKASLVMLKNGVEMISYHAEVQRPLASTAKLIVAVEFARQLVNKSLEQDEEIALEELQRFYIPGSDGGAHEKWLESVKAQNKISEGRVTLFEIARGMLIQSSNANMEFLMQRLGLDAINANLQHLAMNSHDRLFPFSSAGLICSFVQEQEKISFEEALLSIEGMSREEYMAHALSIHDILGNARDASAIKRWNTRKSYARKLQLMESRKQPRGTARDYAHLMRAIQNETLLPHAINGVLKSLLEQPVDATKMKEFGNKGGSSISILTEAFYCTDIRENQIQLALFIHEESQLEQIWLREKTQLFLAKLLTDSQFEEEVQTQLSVQEDDSISPYGL